MNAYFLFQNMDTLQINRFAEENKNTNKTYGGCFASDKLPKTKIPIKFLPYGIILNLCEANRSDEFCHWTAIWITKNVVEYFDSGGTDSFESNRHIKYFIELQEKKLHYNTKQVQSFSSDRCGIFVLLFLYARNVNISFTTFLNVFKQENLNLNDDIADRLFKCSYLKNASKSCFKRK